MSQPKLLIVDDSPNVVNALRRTFAAEGYVILSANSAAEALATLDRQEVDLMLTDENMPGLSGTELLKTVRETYPHIIRIMLTGMTDISVAKNAINSGAIYRFFTKPWDDFELQIAVRQALSQRRLEQDNARLQSLVSKQGEALRQLESEFPGISEKRMADDGSIIIDG